MQFHLNPVAVFWILSVTVCFNVGYGLYLWSSDKSSRKQHAFILRTALIGTLLMIGTYAHNLSTSGEPFNLSDCLYLALVVAHGWTAEKVVDGFIRVRSAAGSVIKDTLRALSSPKTSKPDNPS